MTDLIPAPNAGSEALPPTPDWEQFLGQADSKGRPIESVWLTVVDPHGRLKGKRVSRKHFDPAHTHEMCGYLMSSDGRNNPVGPLNGRDAGYPDMTVIPDLRSAALMPGEPGVAHVVGRAQAQGTDGEPLAIDPHTILTRQLDRLAQLGLHAKVGLETEFVLQRGTREDMHRTHYRRPKPAFARNLDYSTDAPQAVHTYITALGRALDESGHPVEAIKFEGAPGQVEITFPYGDPLQACWWHLRMQRAAMQLAERARMTANFMGAPDTGVGNGLHVHLSLWGTDGKPVFAEDGDQEDDGPTNLDAAIGGLLSTLPGLAPLYAPSPNSYRRYRDKSFAPTRYTWGYDNRTCAVRVVGEGTGRHLEVRLPGADANPLLAVAGAIAGIVHGLTERVKPPSLIVASGYIGTDPKVPASLSDALDAFDYSRTARDAFGADVIEHYVTLGRALVAEHDRQVSDSDRQMWFDRA
ncbi:glutamine synthetase family protein [Streptomyces sp. NPDC004376]